MLRIISMGKRLIRRRLGRCGYTANAYTIVSAASLLSGTDSTVLPGTILIGIIKVDNYGGRYGFSLPIRGLFLLSLLYPGHFSLATSLP